MHFKTRENGYFKPCIGLRYLFYPLYLRLYCPWFCLFLKIAIDRLCKVQSMLSSQQKLCIKEAFLFFYFWLDQNCPQNTRRANDYSKDLNEQIISVGPIRRKRKCGVSPGFHSEIRITFTAWMHD